jgi:hypothetical protein
MSMNELIFVYNTLIRKLMDTNRSIITEDCVELRYKENADLLIESDHIRAITAVFTTANARVRLNQMLDWLQPSQVYCCDTDSVIWCCANVVFSFSTIAHPASPNVETLPRHSAEAAFSELASTLHAKSKHALKVQKRTRLVRKRTPSQITQHQKPKMIMH